MKKYFAGIGSRKINIAAAIILQDYCKKLCECGLILRSGGASGSDIAAEKGCDEVSGTKEIYLPWKGFNDSTSSLYSPSTEAFEVAKWYHPRWNSLSPAIRALMARNSHQVLGDDLKTPVECIVCWTPQGLSIGGTSQAIRIAEDHNIPVFNIASPKDVRQLDFFLSHLILEKIFSC